MTITIKDVAARANVSPKTVSRVMNGEQHVRVSVREAVMRVVDELGYRPNAFARSLSSARSYLIALFSDDPASGYATTMQRGALTRCRERHYHLLVERLDPAAAGWEAILDAIVSELRLDGAILAPPLSQNEELLARLDGIGLPYVRVSPEAGTTGLSGAVYIDEERAAFDMTRHLIAHGHRTIGFVEGDPVHASTASRRAGFVAAARAAGLGEGKTPVVPGDFSFRAGVEAGERLLGATPRPSAIFASNDDMALGVSVAAMKHGLSVPGDLAIAGFDDAFTARLAWPPITTIRQPVEEMGLAAVDILVDPAYRGDSANPAFRRLLGYTLIERGSTAAPAPAERSMSRINFPPDPTP